MTAPPPRRPWRRRKRAWAAVTLWLAIVWPASAGPVQYAAHRGWLPSDALTWHRPLAAVLFHTPAGPAYDRYVEWWWNLVPGRDRVSLRHRDDGLFELVFRPREPG